MLRNTFLAVIAVLFCVAQAGPTLGAKTVILICDLDDAQHPTHDAGLKNAIGTTGVLVGAVTVPGLGYSIVEVDEGAAGGEVDEYTSTDGDLIFVSQTCSAGTVLRHGDDPLPLIMCVQGDFDDSGQQGDMWFSQESSGRRGTIYNITDNTHPITSIFPLGPMTMWVFQDVNQMGVMEPPLGSGVTALAENSAAPGEVCLAVIDQGVTGLMAGAPAGFEPTPARRVCLGFQQQSMTTPTVEAVYLLQRAVQWAIGDPVIAGELTTPTAPTNLTAEPASGAVRLSWNAASGDPTGYRILQSQTSGGSYTEVATVSAAILTYIVTGLQNGTEYFFVVRAFNAAGDGPDSNEASAIPEAGISLRARNWREYE